MTNTPTDTEMLEFFFSTLNEMELFAEWVNRWHPTRATTYRRTTDADWRDAVAKAMGRIVTISPCHGEPLYDGCCGNEGCRRRVGGAA